MTTLNLRHKNMLCSAYSIRKTDDNVVTPVFSTKLLIFSTELFLHDPSIFLCGRLHVLHVRPQALIINTGPNAVGSDNLLHTKTQIPERLGSTPHSHSPIDGQQPPTYPEGEKMRKSGRKAYRAVKGPSLIINGTLAA